MPQRPDFIELHTQRIVKWIDGRTSVTTDELRDFMDTWAGAGRSLWWSDLLREVKGLDVEITGPQWRIYEFEQHDERLK